MNYCPNCGNRLSPADVLCPRCGSLVEMMRPNIFTPSESSPLPASCGAPMPQTAVGRQPEAGKMQPPVSAGPSGADDKAWLEIEEIDADRSENAKAAPNSYPAPEDPQSGFIDGGENTGSAPQTSDETDEGSGSQDASEETEQAASEETEQNAEGSRSARNSARYRDQTGEPTAGMQEPCRPEPRRHIPGIIALFLWILVAAAIFAGFYFADSYITETYGGWNAFVHDISKGKVDLDTDSAYMKNLAVNVSETQTDDGAPAHRFDVSMPDGQSVRVLPLGDTYQMENGSVSFTVSDEAIATSLGLVTTEASMETSGVNLDVTTASQTLNYQVGALTLKLTEADYKRDKPSEQTLSTTDTSLKIVLTVSPEATVFINNSNQSAGIDAFGHLSVTMPLELGDNTFVVEIVQPGRRSVKETFTMTRTLPETALTLRDTYLRIFDSSFECRGSTAPGGSVTASLNGRKFTAIVGSDGVFSIACSLENTGVYQMDVTASKDGFADASSPVLVEYLSSQTAFTDSCKEMTVAKIIKDTAALKGKSIKTTATIDGNIDSENHKQSFGVKAKDGSTMPCYYYGQERLSAELEYTFYGVWDTETNSFYVMFVE